MIPTGSGIKAETYVADRWATAVEEEAVITVVTTTTVMAATATTMATT